MAIHVACLYHATSIRIFIYTNCVQSWKRKIRPFEKQMPISRAVGNDESSSRALFDQRFGEIPRPNHYRKALVLKYTGDVWYLQFRRGGAAEFAIRRGALRVPDDRERTSCINTLGRSAAAAAVNEWSYVTLYPRAIVKLRPESVVIFDRTKRQIIIDDANAVSDS